MLAAVHDLADALGADRVEPGQIADRHSPGVGGADRGVAAGEIRTDGRGWQMVGAGQLQNTSFGFSKGGYRGYFKARMEHVCTRALNGWREEGSAGAQVGMRPRFQAKPRNLLSIQIHSEFLKQRAHQGLTVVVVGDGPQAAQVLEGSDGLIHVHCNLFRAGAPGLPLVNLALIAFDPAAVFGFLDTPVGEQGDGSGDPAAAGGDSGGFLLSQRAAGGCGQRTGGLLLRDGAQLTEQRGLNGERVKERGELAFDDRCAHGASLRATAQTAAMAVDGAACSPVFAAEPGAQRGGGR